MISQSDIAKIVVRQNIHKLKSQIEETEKYLATLEPVIFLLAEIDATAEQNKKDAIAFAEKKSAQKRASSEKSKNWPRIVSAVQRAQELVQRTENNWIKSQQKYNPYLEEYRKHAEALEKLKVAYREDTMLYENLRHHFQNKESEFIVVSEDQKQAFLQEMTFSVPSHGS